MVKDGIPRPVSHGHDHRVTLSPTVKRQSNDQETGFHTRNLASDLLFLVGVAGFEPTASSSRTKRATKLRHTPDGRCGV